VSYVKCSIGVSDKVRRQQQTRCTQQNRQILQRRFSQQKLVELLVLLLLLDRQRGEMEREAPLAKFRGSAISPPSS